MNGPAKQVLTRVEEMRLAFDRGFAEPPRIDTVARENLLAIRVATTAYALRLSEIGGVFSDKKITPVPTPHAALLGIASLRGAVTPVYDLHLLLGFPAANAVRWLVTAATAPVALAFDTFESHLQIPRAAIVPPNAGDRTGSHVREILRTTDELRAIIALESIVTAIRTQVSQTVS